jgi:hypothetical protein
MGRSSTPDAQQRPSRLVACARGFTSRLTNPSGYSRCARNESTLRFSPLRIGSREWVPGSAVDAESLGSPAVAVRRDDAEHPLNSFRVVGEFEHELLPAPHGLQVNTIVAG